MSGFAGHGRRDRRHAVRVDVELPGLWRPCAGDVPPSLAYFYDLSTRGARVAGWTPYDFTVGDCVELHVDAEHVVHASVARVLPGGEYGVRFDEPTATFRALLIQTVGHARAGQNRRWVRPPAGELAVRHR